MFKYALLYGMSSTEFWFGDPQDYFVYQDAFVDKVKKKHDEDDIRAWLFGFSLPTSYVRSLGQERSKQKNIPR